MKNVAIIIFIALIFSCSSNSDNYCTEEFVYGLNIIVKDAVTDVILTEEVTVSAIDGSYEEQLMRIENSYNFLGAGEREGNYTIEITANNYQTFTSNPILVEKTEDDCHVITKVLEFLLQPN